jgi:hypothetical protein
MIRELRSKIADGLFEFTEHAVDQSIIRHITVQKIREAFANSQIIEDYPDDKYGPSCLVLGFTVADRPLHILRSHPSRQLVKIVTLHEPDPDQWIDFRTRRS